MDNRFTAIVSEVEKARKGVAACAVLFLALAVLCFFFSERVLLVLVRLLGKKLVSYSPEEGFIALASLSLYCAFVLMLPVAGYLLWRGILLPRVPAWRRWGGPVIATATALFACGVLLGYLLLLPAGIGFLVGFETRDVRALISAKKFISFCGTMLIALGLSFEAPPTSGRFAGRHHGASDMSGVPSVKGAVPGQHGAGRSPRTRPRAGRRGRSSR